MSSTYNVMTSIISASLRIALDGNVQAITTDKKIWAVKFEFVADPSNANVVLVGERLAAGTLPTDIKTSGAGAGEVNATIVLGALGIPTSRWSPPTPRWWEQEGQQYQLYQYCVKGTAGQFLSLVYPKRANAFS